MTAQCVLATVAAATLCSADTIVQHLPDGSMIMSRAPVTAAVVTAMVVIARPPSAASAASAPSGAVAVTARPSASTLTVYRVSDSGMRSMLPSRVVERDTERGDVRVYDTDAAGNKQFIPSKVIEAAPAGGTDADTEAAVINAVTTDTSENSP